MSINQDNTNTAIGVISVILISLILIIWKASAAINLDFKTGAYFLFRFTGVLMILFALIKFEILSVSTAAPFFIAGVAFALFPALDYWSGHTISEVQFGFAIKDPEWYARWYFKLLFVLTPCAGYFLIPERFK